MAAANNFLLLLGLNNEHREALDMGGKDQNFQVVYRDQILERWIPGGWVFFQRHKAYGGGFWLGQTEDRCFLFGIDRPVSLADGMTFLMARDAEARQAFYVEKASLNYPLF